LKLIFNLNLLSFSYESMPILQVDILTRDLYKYKADMGLTILDYQFFFNIRDENNQLILSDGFNLHKLK